MTVFKVSQPDRSTNKPRITIDGMNAIDHSAMCWIVLIAIAIPASGQSSIKDQSSAQDTQARGYWVDPSTGLVWAGKDNGKNASWKGAVKYCRNLRLGGYSDWRLATLDELKGIYDKNSNAPGRDGLGTSTWHVKGNLYLTGYQWSSNYRTDDRGRNSGYSWYFDFNDGRSSNEPSGFPYPSSFRRAMCVRGPGQ